VPGCGTHIKIEGLSSGQFSRTRPTGANCCNRDGKTLHLKPTNKSYRIDETYINCNII
jgi:hypothetical protein